MTDRIHVAAPDVGGRAKSRVEGVIDDGRLADGREVRRFEDEFADEVDAGAAVATANGTAALQTALRAAGIGEGDVVVTTPFSFVATANAVRLVGARPVFADVRPDTLNLDPDAAAAAVRAYDADAVLVVHLYGHPAAMDRFTDLAERRDLVLVEDAAQAHGAAHVGRPVGAVGDVGAFSFYPTKNMTTGEGGMVVTDDPRIERRARRFVDHGRTGRYEHAEVGQNFRMTNLAAAVGIEQLRRLDGFVEDRRRNAALLSDLLSDDPRVDLPADRPGVRHAYHQYTVRHPDRDGLAAHLEDRGIDTGVYYPTPIHEQPAYDGVDADCPVAQRTAGEVLSLPVHPGLSEADVHRIAEEVNAYDARVHA